MLREGQGLPSWRKIWEEECESVSSPGGLSRIPACQRLRLELGGGRAPGGVVPLGLQGTGGLRISASLPWYRLPAQCPMTDGTTLRTVSRFLGLRRVPELWNPVPGRLPAEPPVQALVLGSSSFSHRRGFSVRLSSVAQSCPTFCDLMDCSTPGLPVLHHLLEFAQTHVH